VDIDLVVTEGLGDNSYVVSIGDLAIAVDPQRDVERLVTVAERRGSRIRWVVETHVHNDYVSGAGELRVATGAEIVGPADAGYAFAFREMRDGEELALGDARLSAIATPGHTPEHTAYLLSLNGEEPLALFSGGSLMVGTAGRTDLLGDEAVGELTRAQFRTVRRLAELSDDVLLMPTHGAGSFCASATHEGPRTSSIGTERVTNPAFVEDESAFLEQQLRDLPAYPTYYARMAPINRAGAPVIGAVELPPSRSADEIALALEGGAVLVDARDGPAFARAHVRGSLNIPLEESFGSYVGWLVPFETPVALVLPDDPAAPREATTQLFRIGYDRLLGVLDGGVDAWRESGRSVSSYPSIDARAFADDVRAGEARDVLDVRQRTEWDEGHLEGTRHVFVGDLPKLLDSFSRDRTITLACASGYRSSMAASILDGAGVPVRLVSPGGVPTILETL
jgi:glyoxylase-like metal-dependent hydrolase (beta-lactamase superfamily II)/rhodanese-related sulfurtransferase